MLKTILGSKVKMDQAFVNGRRTPVTFIKAGPCVVTQIKDEKKDGYWAVQIGFGEKKIGKIKKPIRGHLKGAIGKSKVAPRFLCEVKFSEMPKAKKGKSFKVGDKITVSDIFSSGDKVDVVGVSKGKGFAGVIKRWGFAGGPRTHGQSDRERAPGSIGQGTTPGRVRKGKKMPGRMGTKRTYIKNLKVISVDSDNNQMAISGPLPGSSGTLLFIKKHD